MLREYEKAKLQMMNQDIVNSDGEVTNEDPTGTGGRIASMNNTGMSKSPYNNFTRTTNG